MADDADRIIELYDRHARAWETQRGRELFERPWLDRFLALVPRGGSVLDLGCGSGEPIARTLIEAGYGVTGVDSSPAMIALCESSFPDARWLSPTCAGCPLANASTASSPGTAFFTCAPAISERCSRSSATTPPPGRRCSSPPAHAPEWGWGRGRANRSTTRASIRTTTAPSSRRTALR